MLAGLLLFAPASAPASAGGVAFEILSSEALPCFDTSLCVDVEAKLSGEAVFGSNDFEIPLPRPDPQAWIPVVGSIWYSGSFAGSGSYATSLVRSREAPPNGALMGVFHEDLSFRDAAGTLLTQPGTQQTILCAPVPADYTDSTFPCADGNGGSGGRDFGPGELGWSQHPIDLGVVFATTPPAPVEDSERFRLGDQSISVSVVYDPAPPPADMALEIVSSELGPCEGILQCARVVAVLTGSTGFGNETFSIPLPAPDRVQWGPISASIGWGSGGMGIRGRYLTSEVRAREHQGYGALMGFFEETLRFLDSRGTPIFERGASTGMACVPVPAGATAPSFPCVDGNPVVYREQAFASGALVWTQGPIGLSVEVSGTEPLPISGTERLTFQDQRIEIVVKYSADSDGDGVPQPSDNCPTSPNPGQEDRSGLGGSLPDGIGDACQCGDVDGDGAVGLADVSLIRRFFLTPPAAILPRPELCDVGGIPGCTLGDAQVLQRALLSPPRATIAPACTENAL